MYDVPPLLPCSPQPARSKASSTPTRQSPLRLSSPSKARATPSQTRQTSPRKSPAKSRVFHAMSTQPVSFTPEKTKQPPRAWERRPATPFVPRDDKQKIWKRVPLGEIGIESNRPMNISRREQDATKDYVRVVKKLKVGHGSDDEDKENVSVGVRVDVEDKDPKRRARFESRFVAMKAEEDVILGSPKKKLRTVTDGSIPPAEEEVSEELEREGIEEGMESVKEGEAVRTRDQATDEEHVDQDQQGTPDQEDGLFEETYSATENPQNDDPASEEGVSDASCVADVHGPGDVLDTTLSSHGSDLQTTLPERVSDTFEHENPEPADLNDRPLSEQSMELDGPVYTSDQLTDGMEDDVAENTRHMPEEPRSSSPPTVLAENVIIDELESRNVSRLDAPLIDQRSLSDNSREAPEAEDTPSEVLTSRRISDDEATFLRNFVSTSKAERAARDRKIQEMLLEESTDQEGEIPLPQAESNETGKEMTFATEDMPNLEPPTEVLLENISSSPLRRSKRAAITSIPRPQTLPNAIQLKRANGNEFIFTANKASSMVNAAVLTRSNTKRNKASALSVPERLEQLLAAEEDVANSAEHAHAIGDDIETSDKLAAEKSDLKTETKKRKRGAKDGGVRTKKVLRWNDEKLVSYQETERNVDEWDDIDDSSQENNTSRDHEPEDSDKHVKLTLTMASNSNGSAQNSVSAKEALTSSKTSTKDEKETSTSTLNSSHNKLRRVRRGTSGTVNGTPGPKTRSRRVADNDEQDMATDGPVDMNGSVEDSTAATMAISNLAAATEMSKTNGSNGAETGRKSRMPVPVPVGARRGPAASASIRGAGTVAKISAGKAGAVAGVGSSEARKVKETSKSQSQTKVPKDDGKGDLLGKRRLRVRP